MFGAVLFLILGNKAGLFSQDCMWLQEMKLVLQMDIYLSTKDKEIIKILDQILRQ